MAEAVTLGDRMKEARLQAAARRREVLSQGAMAALVSKAVGRTIHQTQWGKYEAGTSEPPIDVIAAAAKLSGLPNAYLAFGESVAVLPDPALDRKLTDTELQRALRKDEAESAAAERTRLASSTRRKRGGGRA